MAHATAVSDHTEAYSEERTEPFSQSEMEARFRKHAEESQPHRRAVVPLEALRIDDSHLGVRILVRDLTNSRSVSPSDSVRWLALRAEVASSQEPEHQVLAVTQTHKDIKFSVRIPGELLERPPLWCELYYDPASDNQILVNRSDEPITLAPLSTVSSPGGPTHTVNPGSHKALSPATWRISVRAVPVLDFRILEKRPFALTQGGPAPFPVTGKRSFSEYDEAAETKGKKQRVDGADKDGVIMFLRKAAQPLVFPLPNGEGDKQVSAAVAQPLLDLEENETVHVPGVNAGTGDCEIDGYQVTKRNPIASSVLSTVYTAQHSNVTDGIITVKVLKTKMASPRPQENERNVIRQADMWLREYQNQDDLQHDSIVKLYGGDARFLSLYMEHVDAKDLSSKSEWRSITTDGFIGSRADAARILYDIAGALQYLHSRKIVHNDIKPGNILYSRGRGAVLCDFGLSTTTSNMLTTGGTPYYIPPEFIGNKQRGPPSDVWALGIVMLYLIGKITFPEARGSRRHPRQLYWLIADVNRSAPQRPPADQSPVVSARMQMQMWLSEITDAKEKLSTQDWLEALIADMLLPNPKQRIAMDRILTICREPQARTLMDAARAVGNEVATIA